MRRFFIIILFFSTIFYFPAILKADKPSTSSADIHQALNKLKVLGSVLYIAAHPDDENTSVLAYMAKGRLLRTAYLSLTRGSGGQNLLGNEKGDLLGVLRTQELLSARRIDGGEQFFSRAIDFGYSKRADETLEKWGREKILSDVVRIIRYFRPDVIITRFSETRGGHGHHISSAILAKEAFIAAADPQRFPEQLKEVAPWQAKRIFWNTRAPSDQALSIDVGTYDPLLGQSYAEFAAASRSMHKSQGFGVSPNRGTQITQFDLMAGDSANSDLFEGIDLTWKRIGNGEKVEKDIDKIINQFDPQNPAESVPQLLTLYQYLTELPHNYWVNIKIREVNELVRLCSGLWLESIVLKEGCSPGMTIDVRSMVVNRSSIPMKLKQVEIMYSTNDTLLNHSLEWNTPFSFKSSIRIPENAPYTQPFWLHQTHAGNVYQLDSPDQLYRPASPPALATKFNIAIDDIVLTYEIPVRYRWNDAIKGERFRPFIIRPELSAQIDQPTYLFNDGKSREVKVKIGSKEKNLKGDLRLTTPAGWRVAPESIPFSLADAGDQTLFRFEITPDEYAVDGQLILQAHAYGKTYKHHVIQIDYEHIPVQTVLQPASARLVNLDIEVLPGKIGYVMGSGDEIPQCLSQLGYEVHLLTDDDLEMSDLSVYDAVICGIRAFNTRKALNRLQKSLLDYTEKGGTWIVQHNTRFGFKVEQIGPYPFSTSGRDRISEEDAPIQILAPDHPVMNYPNKITEDDFDGWIQERGLYFADSWQGKLYPLLSGNDKNEPSKLGGLLYARFGEGVFIFTAYSWFRQLPAGVPGAYRIFVNMISAKGKRNDEQ